MENRTTGADTVVFIHGLYMTARSWEQWEKRFTERGYKVINKNWPGLEGEVEALRQDPSPIARLNVRMIVDHYGRIITGLERPPIIMGHSFGGAFTQVLLSRGLGAAGVTVDSASVRGVLDLPLSTLRASWPLLRNPLFRHRAVNLTPKQFHYAFTNTMNEEESRRIYERYNIPGSRNVLFEGANANVNPFTSLRVDYKKGDRAPLLFIAGGKDHIIPPSVNRHNAGKYRKSSAITDFVEFPERSHFTLGQPGWEQVADIALEWAVNPGAEVSAAAARPVQRMSGSLA